jgi:hypothetical protein
MYIKTWKVIAVCALALIAEGTILTLVRQYAAQ